MNANYMTKITIIIPVYKVEKYINDCIQSVFMQTMKDGLECILVDDCGGDNSIKIAKSLIDDYSGNINFKILYHNKNLGLSAARNTAIRQSSGAYFFFLDSDDTITPTSMEDFWSLVENYPGVDLVQGFMYRENGNTTDIPKNKYPVFMKNANRIRYNMSRFKITDAGCNRLIRRGFLLDNNLFLKEGYLQEDTIWAFDIQRKIETLAFCEKFTYFYRTTPNSIMTSLTNEKEAQDFAKVFDVCIKKIKNEKPHPFDLLYLGMLSARVKNADKKLCIDLLPIMQMRSFGWLTNALYTRSYSKSNIIIQGIAELMILPLCYWAYLAKAIYYKS